LLPIRPKAFISYRHVSPDQDLAKAIHEFLEHAQLETFLDTGITLGSSWETQIDASLGDCTHFIVILSGESITSDMVRQEVWCAYRRMKQGQTLILPVWIGEPQELPYALGAWLNPLQYALWRDSEGYEAILETLLRAIQGGCPLPLAGLSAGEEAKQQVLNQTAVAGAHEDLLLRSVAGEMRPSMREIFRVVTSSEQIPSALATGPDGHREPPYVTRQLASNSLQAELLTALHRRGRALVRGRAGLGKTREIAELMATMLRNGWACMVYDSSQTALNLPRNIETVTGKKTQLVFDGLHDA
jgi:hypothetical protein